jgi:hypothetical protein
MDAADHPDEVWRVLSLLPGLAYFRHRSLRNPRWPAIHRTGFILTSRLEHLRQPGSPLNPVVDDALRLYRERKYDKVPGAVDAIISEAERLWEVTIRPETPKS